MAVPKHVRGALAAAVVLALAACTGEPEPEPLSLDRDGDAGQVEDPEEPTSPPGDDEGPDDDWLPPEDVQALYASLPPLEPDPDSPVDEATQREVLAAHERYFHVISVVYATATLDEAVARDVMTDELVEVFANDAEQYAAEGRVNRTSTVEISWVRVIEAEGDEAKVRECNLVPPDAVAVDIETGEPIPGAERTTTVPVLYEVTYVRDPSGSSRPAWRASATTMLEDGSDCEL